MPDAEILKTLRNQVLDESESLTGLLRKCLVLGADTGSEDLRSWANNELKGYDAEAELPSYRCINAQLFIDQRGGNEFVTGQTINRQQIPSDLRENVPETLDFRQPVEELARMATSGQKSHRMSYEGFTLIAALWSKEAADVPDSQLDLLHDLAYNVRRYCRYGQNDAAGDRD